MGKKSRKPNKSAKKSKARTPRAEAVEESVTVTTAAAPNPSPAAAGFRLTPESYELVEFMKENKASQKHNEDKPSLRFKVGDRVQCAMQSEQNEKQWGELLQGSGRFSVEQLLMRSLSLSIDNSSVWSDGTVIALWCGQNSPRGNMPYQVILDDGDTACVPQDNDQYAKRSSTISPCQKQWNDSGLWTMPKERSECPIICSGCVLAASDAGLDEKCPFCRAPSLGMSTYMERMKVRAAKDDPENLGSYSLRGKEFQKDLGKGFELLLKSVEVDPASSARHSLALSYFFGVGCETNRQRALEHFEISAKNGNGVSRCFLADLALRAGDETLAYKHLMIAAKAGYMSAIEPIKRGYSEGVVTKEELANALRMNKESRDALRSESRDRAFAEALKRGDSRVTY
ncbi:hypothetical protein THAOC_08733 [Thalassiosira oceanica]|uniref:Uncharacterized protein n=1 Tax=Thalassiosira oceanica TaxID=159749 RepID=K0THI8_THAOC|nr:hypothetical protein THAOC_08733 [Thalassiosira oceanica]|eukprot:EJK69957.1 hypothetical protein THAOC_08733 [Thalassiosira oceanica]